jgi:hypothetical protein
MTYCNKRITLKPSARNWTDQENTLCIRLTPATSKTQDCRHIYLWIWSINKCAKCSGRTNKHSENFQIRWHSIKPFQETLCHGGTTWLILHSDLVPTKQQEAEKLGKSQVPPHPRLLLANPLPGHTPSRQRQIFLTNQHQSAFLCTKREYTRYINVRSGFNGLIIKF